MASATTHYGEVFSDTTYTVEGLARAAGCNEVTVRRWLKMGLRYAQPGGPNGKKYISGRDFLLWIEEQSRLKEDHDDAETPT